ncbi:hypothetical protein ACRALDRAFT_1056336 [Sodiomyces alcalophilus JCM 7366]|uniref:uncharacterized protein n=1 Tax=Sodiomyces alcalophilus JCM 7366 TaxID=591952 RepID=UPI0039B60968
MVSFFGLKLGGDKKKKANTTAESVKQWKKNEQNSRNDDRYFGTTLNKHDLLNDPFSIPRPDTAASLRSSRPRAPYLNPAASSSSPMVDLVAAPATILHTTQPSISNSSSTNLRQFASDNNLHARWNDTTSSPLRPLQPPHLTRIPGAATMERPGSAGPGSTRKPWVNPLDVHFCRDRSGFTPTPSRPSTATGARPAPPPLTPEPPPPPQVSTSPLSQFNFDLKPLGTGPQQLEGPQPRVPDTDPLVPEPLRPRKQDQAPYPAPGDELRPPLTQPGPRNDSLQHAVAYPSPPLSMDNVPVDQPSMGSAMESDMNARPAASRQAHSPEGLNGPTTETTAQAPTLLPSPTASPPQISDDWEGMGRAVIQNVAAKRDTLTFNAPRRRSLSLNVQKPGQYQDDPGISSRNGSPPLRNARRPPPPPLENRDFRSYTPQAMPSPTTAGRNREFRAYIPPGSPGHTPAMGSGDFRLERSAGSPSISSSPHGARGPMHGLPATRRPSPALLDGRPQRGSPLVHSPSQTSPPSSSIEAYRNMPPGETLTADSDLRPRRPVDFAESTPRDVSAVSASEANLPPLARPAPEPHPNIDPNHPSKGPQDFNMQGRRRPTIGAAPPPEWGRGFGERGPGLSPGKRRPPPPRLNTVPPSAPPRPHPPEEQLLTSNQGASYHFPAWDDRHVFSSPRRAPTPLAVDNSRAPTAAKASPGLSAANWPLADSSVAVTGADAAGVEHTNTPPSGSVPSSPGLFAGTPFASPGLGGFPGGSGAGKSHSTAPPQWSQDGYLMERPRTPPYVREAKRRDAGSPAQQPLPPHHGLRAPTGIADEFQVGFI